MMTGCVVFDFDGTIVDTEEPVYRSWWELWDEHGHELVLADWQAIIGKDSSYDPWTELERRLGRPLDPSLAQARRDRRDELQAGYDVRAGVLDWLAEADHLGVPVGIASSSPLDWVEGHLDRLGLRERFACLVCCDEVVPAKPDPTSYRV
ncbi:MAG: HAD family hydrolase, partial [Acidimicrobiales bacterium]